MISFNYHILSSIKCLTSAIELDQLTATCIVQVLTRKEDDKTFELSFCKGQSRIIATNKNYAHRYKFGIT